MPSRYCRVGSQVTELDQDCRLKTRQLCTKFTRRQSSPACLSRFELPSKFNCCNKFWTYVLNVAFQLDNVDHDPCNMRTPIRTIPSFCEVTANGWHKANSTVSDRKSILAVGIPSIMPYVLEEGYLSFREECCCQGISEANPRSWDLSSSQHIGNYFPIGYQCRAIIYISIRIILANLAITQKCHDCKLDWWLNDTKPWSSPKENILSSFHKTDGATGNQDY